MEKRIFSINVAHIPDDKVEEYIKRVANEYNTTVKYEDNQHIISNSDITYYLETIPNSHSFPSLESVLTLYKHQPEIITIEYLLIGFKNALKNGYKLIRVEEKMTQSIYFATIESIISYLKTENNIKTFINLITNTLDNGYNLKNIMKMKTEEVYSCLDTEMKYQDLRWKPRREKNNTPDKDKAPAEWLNYMEYHLNEAKREIYLLNEQEALAHIRKITALGVKCLKIHGCPERIIPDELLNND